MNKIIGIIGALLMVVAAVFGKLFDFPSESVIEIAVSAFGFVAILKSVITEQKEKGNFTWKSVVTIACATGAGFLCCLGGLNQNILIEISGAAIALVTVIISAISSKK